MANSRDSILNLFPDNNNNEITASKIRQFITAIFDEEIDINEIQDRLNATDVDKPLSANMGRVLNSSVIAVDGKVDTKEDTLPSGNVDEVLSLDANLNKVWVAQQSFVETVVIDDLLSTSDTDALSANQGRILDGKISTEASINVSQDALIAQNASDILDSDARITQNEADIAQNVIDITTNASGISTNIGRINTNVTDIANLNATVGQHTTDIAQNTGDIVAVNSRVDITNVNVSQNANDISLLTPRVQQNETNIGVLQGLVGGFSSASLDARITQNTLDVNTNTGAISTLDARVTGQDSLIGANTTSINANVSSINALDTRIDVLEAQDPINQGNIAQNTSDIADLDVRVTQNEADIVVNQVNITNNTTAIGDVANDLNITNTNVDNNTADINTLRGDVDANQVAIGVNVTDIDNNSALIENNRVDIVRLGQDLENTDTQVAQNTTLINGKEDFLSIPATDLQVLASYADGSRVWVDNAFSASTIEVRDYLIGQGDTTNALSANMGYVLDQDVKSRELYLETPYKDNMILTSLIDGTRIWREANILTVDYGGFFGFGDPITSVVITPSAVTYFTSQSPTQFTAVANRSASSQDVTASSDWATTNASVATVSLTGVVTIVGVGTANITSSVDNGHGTGTLITGTSTITVNEVLIATVAVTPDALGLGQGVQQVYIATATYNDGAVQDVTDDCQWTSGDANLITVTNAFPDKGLALTNSLGITGGTTINTSIDDGSGSNDILGVASVSVTI